jgi:catechol 2,3-dioxygenase-like lactoylglutathione lyase family enzyme
LQIDLLVQGKGQGESLVKMTRLIPMLPVASLAKSIAFYEKLGFQVEKRQDNWGWAMLRFDECQIMLDRSINTNPGAERQSVLYLYPEDIDLYHTQVAERGLAIAKLDRTFYGMTEFRIDDPDGNRLWIGQIRESAA